LPSEQEREDAAMKKRIFWWAAILLLLALLVAPRYVRFPEDAVVTVTSFGESAVLSVEDSEDVVERLNRYKFWMREIAFGCDCASDFGITVGDAKLSGGGHLHWDERGLTLNLEDEDAREIEWLVEKYLYRE